MSTIIPEEVSSTMLLYTTVSSLAEAEELAQGALQAKLAACVNILSQGHSLYIWQGQIEKAKEYYLLFKTSAALLTPLQAWILQHHSYETPAILSWEAKPSKAFGQYLQEALAREAISMDQMIK